MERCIPCLWYVDLQICNVQDTGPKAQCRFLTNVPPGTHLREGKKSKNGISNCKENAIIEHREKVTDGMSPAIYLSMFRIPRITDNQTWIPLSWAAKVRVNCASYRWIIWVLPSNVFLQEKGISKSKLRVWNHITSHNSDIFINYMNNN